jgi:hypothetical protein
MHQEMGFKPFGVCTKEFILTDAQKSYNAEKCPYKVKYEDIEDCLVIGVDFDSRTDNGVITVGRHQDEKLYIINVLENDEALDIYNKLIGKGK